MRQIKFRGFCIKLQKWAYGYLYVDCKNNHIILTGGDSMIVPGYAYLHGKLITSEYFHEVDPNSVGQFTGLFDKNGREIYEGDIVTDKFDRKCIVIWHSEYACFALKTSDAHEYDFALSDTNEIIGTIHENPELIQP